MKKRIISIVLILLMVISVTVLPMSASAAQGVDIGSIIGGVTGGSTGTGTGTGTGSSAISIDPSAISSFTELIGGNKGFDVSDIASILLALYQQEGSSEALSSIGKYFTGVLSGNVTFSGPESVTVFAGQSATFKVEIPKTIADLFSDHEYTYVWLDVTTSEDIDLEAIVAGQVDAITALGDKVLSTTNTLTLPNVTEADSGRKFACVAFTAQRKSLAFGVSDAATLTVLPLTDCRHTVLKPVSGIEPTCGDPGNIPYYKCTVCGNIFLDSNAQNVTTPEMLIIPATGHKTVGGIRVEPTCTVNGHTEGGTCIYCGKVIEEQLVLVAPGHTPETVVEAVEPTCEKTGMSAQIICSVCKEVLQESEEIPATGHTYVGAKCSKCDSFRANPFIDVNKSDYYFESVLWAVYSDPQVTQGTDRYHFSPSNYCTRGQVVTFLWRAAGSPEPMLKISPFSDVTEDNYFYKAVLWAFERGITTGISSSEFAPYRNVTRAQFVTFLWRFMGEPIVQDSSSPFSDVRDTYSPFYIAILWAAENGITTGRTAETFAPDDICTRANVVTFIFRGLVK